MTDRIIEIAETAAFLSLENNLLKIRIPEKDPVMVPVKEIQCLILANPAVTVSGAALSALADVACMVVVSGADRLPTGMMIPLNCNYLMAERVHAQINASVPLKKRLWQTVVQEKIRRQALLLKEIKGAEFSLDLFSRDVRSGDTNNMEGRAAAVYWKNLFRSVFVRDRAADDNNLLLNYGYAVLRAMTARACCAAGLLPAIGINHHNRYDHYCLADDLMEPFRPVVDRQVVKMNPDNLRIGELKKEYRAALIGALLGKMQTANGIWSITDLLRISAEQLTRSFTTGDICLKYS